MSGQQAGMTLALLAVPMLRQATPLLLAAMGGVLSERSGVVNIALEGMMLAGAFAGVVASQSMPVAVALAVAIGIASLLGALHVLLTQRFRLNQIVSGIAINLLALNGTTFLARRLFTQAVPPRPVQVPHALPVGLFAAVALVLPFVLHFLLTRTRFGLRLRASGEGMEGALMSGIRPVAYRTAAVVAGSALAGAAGAYLSMAQVGRFGDNMVSGRGFIALAAVICGRWHPLYAAVACLAFGALDAAQLQLQGSLPVPAELLRSLPYLLTMLASMLIRSRPPADLGKPPALPEGD